MGTGDSMSRTKAEKAQARKLFKKPKGALEPIDLTNLNPPRWMTRAYKNNRVVVMINDNEKMTHGVTAIKAMVQRHDDQPIPNHWRVMQDIKNELFGSEAVAIEYYPAESKLEDLHNIYWLWVLPPEVLPTRLS